MRGTPPAPLYGCRYVEPRIDLMSSGRSRPSRSESSAVVRLLRIILPLVPLLAACSGSAAAPAAAPSPSPAKPLALLPTETALGNARQITFGGNNAEAYWARSGTKLIFQRQEKNDEGCDQQYVINADGSDMRRVSSGKGRTTCGYFWDGDRKIIYASSQAFEQGCPASPDKSAGYVWPLNVLDLWTADADGRNEKRLTTDATYNAEATLSPDGKRLIFTSMRDGDLEIYTMKIDGTDIRRITNRLGYDGGPFYSHDGKSIVWRAGYPVTAKDSTDYKGLLAQRLVRPAKMELWVADADGRNARQITNLGGANFAPYFTPDDRQIIFSSNHPNPRSRNFDLFVVNRDGTGLKQITFDPEFDGFPQFSPNGKQLVWASNRNASREGDTNLFIADWVP